MVCKGLCSRYKAKWLAHEYRYANGQKRCNHCQIYLQWDGHYCPCCGRALRTKPRASRNKTIFLSKTKEVNEITL